MNKKEQEEQRKLMNWGEFGVALHKMIIKEAQDA